MLLNERVGCAGRPVSLEPLTSIHRMHSRRREPTKPANHVLYLSWRVVLQYADQGATALAITLSHR